MILRSKAKILAPIPKNHYWYNKTRPYWYVTGSNILLHTESIQIDSSSKLVRVGKVHFGTDDTHDHFISLRVKGTKVVHFCDHTTFVDKDLNPIDILQLTMGQKLLSWNNRKQTLEEVKINAIGEITYKVPQKIIKVLSSTYSYHIVNSLVVLS